MLTIVIVGGRPTGVEVVGAIAEIAHQVMKSDFRNIGSARRTSSNCLANGYATSTREIEELRLRGLNDPVAATPFLPAFMADYNARFAKPPRVAYNAHRPLRPADDLEQIFTWQETRQISRQLTVHYKRDLYVLEDSLENRRLRRTTVLIREDAQGRVTMRANGRLLVDGAN